MADVFIPRMAAQIRAFRDRYATDGDVRQMFKDADDLAILVTKYGEGELAEADLERYAVFEEFGHGEQPESTVMGLVVLLEALDRTPRLVPLIVGKLLKKLHEALEP